MLHAFCGNILILTPVKLHKDLARKEALVDDGICCMCCKLMCSEGWPLFCLLFHLQGTKVRSRSPPGNKSAFTPLY